MRVVIADDSDLFRSRLRDELRNIENVEIIAEAITGLEALQETIEKEPDLLFLDIRMPELGGISVLQKIKEAGLKCKIIILTNFNYTQYREKCLAEGADYFLYKSDDFPLIQGIVEKIALQIKED